MTRKQFDQLIDLLDVNQKELAWMLGVTTATINQWHEQHHYPAWFREWVLGRLCIKRHMEQLMLQEFQDNG